MNLCTPFILRPVATTLLTLGLALAGAVAFFMLPVAPLPQVDSPRISISASLPGASPETMASSVAMPLERALGRIAGITEMTSSSSLGSTRISVEFDLNRDIDGAARDVQGAINAARALLPTGLPNNPTYRKINPADAPIMMLALTSQSKSRGQLYDVASTVIAQKLSQIEGVGQVSVSGSSLPAVRVELNPYALNHYGISLSDVRTAIAATNANRPKGSLVDGDRHWQILANDQAFKAREYEPLIVGYKDGAAVRLADVAQVLDSVEDLRNAGSANGKPSVLLQIFRQPNANIIETIDRVKEELHQVRASIPTAIDVDVMMDRSPSIRASLHEVEKTLVISVGLVIMVVFLFLRNARAALIPSVAVPVSLISTFAAMYLCGFSLNNISLMALTVATGFVVDDAIVVIENINRYLEKGERPLRAALLGAQEVGFTVVSMSFSLVAVFIPLLLMGGLIGRQFREFAVTLSVAILVSLVVSLTLTPMMCSRLLNKQTLEGENNNRLSRWGKQIFDAMLAFYRRSLAWALDHPRLIMFILLATIGLNIYLYIIVPKGFFPQQDIGRIMGSIEADQSISFQAMQPKLDRFVELVREDPAVESVTAFTGGGRRNSGSMFINLKPLSEREDSAAQVINRLRKTLAHEPGATLYMRAAQDIRVGGRSSSAEYQYTLQADDLEELRSWEPQVRRAMSQVNEIVDVNTDEQQRGLQTELVVDRDAAMRLGVDMRTIDDTLNNAFGQRQVSTIYNPLNQYRVVMELAPQYWQHPEALQLIHVFNKDGERVPLSAFSSYRPTLTSLSVNHQGQFAASTISFNLAEGVSLSQAQTAVRDAMERIGLPTSVRGSFQGTARAFQASMESQPWLILAALVAVYIVLGILYESYVHPLTILSTLPSAGVGAILALMLFKTEFSMIAFIGVILLIGIVKKNAIMMIDFALQAERSRNLNSRQAIFEACLLRFRPIMMTTLAAALGAIPLAIGSGDGAELRRPLGMSIVGGLLVSQLLTLYTTPVVYIYLDHFGLYWRRLRNKGRPASSAEGHGVAQPVFQENPL